MYESTKEHLQRTTIRLGLIEYGCRKEGSSLETTPRAEVKMEGMAAVNNASHLHLVSYQEKPVEKSDITLCCPRRK